MVVGGIKATRAIHALGDPLKDEVAESTVVQHLEQLYNTLDSIRCHVDYAQDMLDGTTRPEPDEPKCDLNLPTGVMPMLRLLAEMAGMTKDTAYQVRQRIGTL